MTVTFARDFKGCQLLGLWTVLPLDDILRSSLMGNFCNCFKDIIIELLPLQKRIFNAYTLLEAFQVYVEPTKLRVTYHFLRENMWFLLLPGIEKRKNEAHGCTIVHHELDTINYKKGGGHELWTLQVVVLTVHTHI